MLCSSHRPVFRARARSIARPPRCDLLKARHPHARDRRVHFESEGHTYFVDGQRCSGNWVSTTALVSDLFPKFDADEVIERMMSSPRWPSSKYYGMTPEAIKALWQTTKDEAMELGNEMHKQIEHFYQHGTEPTGLVSAAAGGEEAANVISLDMRREMQLFRDFRNDHAAELTPYRSEMFMFAEDVAVTGCADMLYKDQGGNIVLCDWKRSKAIETANRWRTGTHWATGRLPDCNFVRYSLQLGIYKRILEGHYGFSVAGAFIVVLHPNQAGYMKLVAMDLDDVVSSVFAERRLMR
jgi:hypothetical protein